MRNRMVMAVWILSFLFSCTHTVPITVSPAINVYSSYEDKVSGTVVLVMDEDLRTITQEVKPSSHTCGAHTYPIKIDSALTASIKQTTEALFENVIEQNNLPTKEQLKQMNAKGSIFVKLNSFSPKLFFSAGLLTASSNANCELVLDVTVKDVNNKILMVTSLGGERSAEIGIGWAGSCSNGANVLSDAISKTIHDTMEHYARRLSNSDKIRSAFAGSETPEDTEKQEP